MRYAIISDIHGNLEALQSVLSEIGSAGVESIWCLGDIVGYGPNPNECIDIIRGEASVIVAGNHDHAPLGKFDLSYFNPWARTAIEWTASQLTQTSKEFLLELPLKMSVEDFTLVHATPLEPNEWHYVITIADAAKNFEEFQGQFCFIGHSHVPLIVSKSAKDDLQILKSTALVTKPDMRYIINVGSVGQPRDLNPRACYGILDDKEQTYQLYRVDYDMQETQDKIRAANLPEFLATRLSIGQ